MIITLASVTMPAPPSTPEYVDTQYVKGTFFAVRLEDQIVYARTGNQLQINGSRQLTLDGLVVADDITIPTDTSLADITISSEGKITAATDGDNIEIGSLTLYTFPHPAHLTLRSHNTFSPTEQSGIAMALSTDEVRSYCGTRRLSRDTNDTIENLLEIIKFEKTIHTIQNAWNDTNTDLTGVTSDVDDC